MRRKLFRSDNPWLLSSDEPLQESVRRNEKITFLGAAHNQKVIGVRYAVTQTSKRWYQRFGFRQIHRQDAKVLSDSLELRSTRQICRQKQFLKNNRVHGKTDSAIRFRGKQLRHRRIALKVGKDHTRVQKYERSTSTWRFDRF